MMLNLACVPVQQLGHVILVLNGFEAQGTASCDGK